MKSSELQIGDWVRTPINMDENGYVYDNDRIVSIGLPTCDDYTTLEFDIEGDCEFLQPIEITKEILEKNGFVSPTIDDPEFKNYVFKDTFIHKEQLPNVELLRVNYYDGVEWDFYALLGERKSSDCGEQYEYMATIKYVHELQHILKLCGIEKDIIL